jgi:hypothetical protein
MAACSSEAKQCSVCLYGEAKWGAIICMRYPPWADHKGEPFRPAVGHDHWCGEWRPKGEECKPMSDCPTGRDVFIWLGGKAVGITTWRCSCCASRNDLSFLLCPACGAARRS